MVVDYSKRIFGLDIVRALAILLVLCSHSTLLLFPNENNLILTLIQFFGAIGVDLFFVLSGYLIGSILLKQVINGKTKPKDFLYFWIRRWFRTLPNYVLVLLLNILILFIFNLEIVEEFPLYFVFLQNFSTAHPNFFTEAWSLSIEEFAYIIGPIFLMFFLRTFKKLDIQILFLIMAIVVIVIVTLFRIQFHCNTELHTLKEWSASLRKVVIYRVDSFFYGFIAVFFMLKYKDYFKRNRNRIFLLGMLLFFLIHSLVFFFSWQPENAQLFFVVFYLPIVSVCLLSTFPVFLYFDNFQSLKVSITNISILSYGLYLVNYSIVLLTLQRYIDVSQLSHLEKGTVLLVYWSLSFGIAMGIYKYFEKPIMDLRDSELIKSKFKE